MSYRAFVRTLSTVAVATWAAAASAQRAPEDTTPPPPSTTPGNDEQPPPQQLAPCPPKPNEQAAVPPAPPPPAYATAPEQQHRHNKIFAPQEVSVTTGAGPMNYFGTATNGSMDVGAGWDARVTVGARSVFALEAGYVGASNTADLVNTGESQHARVDSQGLDGDVRIQLPTVVEPYAFTGVGYNHMTISNQSGPTGAGPLREDDNQVTIPAGGGVTGYIGRHATVDLRGTYRFIPNNGLTLMFPDRNLHQWMAQARIGYTF